jgi:hypothetical protein
MRLRPLLTLLLCIALSATRISGAHQHWHVQEPSSASNHPSEALEQHRFEVEAAYGFDNHHHDDDQGLESVVHLDVDVDVLSDGTGKLPKLKLPLLVLLLGCCALLLLSPRRSVAPPRLAPARKPIARAYLRPPLRGPPSVFIA